ncbi:hypothetical protein HOG21_05930 [bacterium]|nr:hypothetical protein [bacterium]
MTKKEILLVFLLSIFIFAIFNYTYLFGMYMLFLTNKNYKEANYIESLVSYNIINKDFKKTELDYNI